MQNFVVQLFSTENCVKLLTIIITLRRNKTLWKERVNMKRSDCNSAINCFCACSFKYNNTKVPSPPFFTYLFELKCSLGPLSPYCAVSVKHHLLLPVEERRIDFLVGNAIFIEMFVWRCEGVKRFFLLSRPKGEIEEYSQKSGGSGWKDKAGRALGSMKYFRIAINPFHSFVMRRGAFSFRIFFIWTFTLFAQGLRWKCLSIFHRSSFPIEFINLLMSSSWPNFPWWKIGDWFPWRQ